MRRRPKEEDAGMNTAEAAKYCGLAGSTLCRKRDRNEGPPYKKYGEKTFVYYAPDLDRWMKTREFKKCAKRSARILAGLAESNDRPKAPEASREPDLFDEIERAPAPETIKTEKQEPALTQGVSWAQHREIVGVLNKIETAIHNSGSVQANTCDEISELAKIAEKVSGDIRGLFSLIPGPSDLETKHVETLAAQIIAGGGVQTISGAVNLARQLVRFNREGVEPKAIRDPASS